LGSRGITVLSYPFRDPATPGIVTGECHDVGATILLSKAPTSAAPILGVVDRIGDESFQS